MRDICRAANLSPGAVYRYFEGKDAILSALAEARQRQIAAFFRRLTGQIEDQAGRAEIAAALAALITSLGGNAAKEGLRLDLRLWSEALDSPEVSRALGSGLDTVIHDLSDGVPHPLGTEGSSLPRLLIALLQGLALQKALDPKVDLDQIASGLVALVGRGP